MNTAAVDLFAGPGGLDLGARAAGVDPLGIEWDDAAVATRKAAGLRTLQADVAQLDPLAIARKVTRRRAGIDGLLASPPCQSYSAAGKQLGRHDIDIVTNVALALSRGQDTRAEALPDCADPRSLLVVEPLRWALALEPRSAGATASSGSRAAPTRRRIRRATTSSTSTGPATEGATCAT